MFFIREGGIQGTRRHLNVIFKKPIHVETNFDPIAIGKKDVELAMEVRR
jgi:hypothetical protein